MSKHSGIIVREGLPLVVSLGVITVAFLYLGKVWAGSFFLIMTLFVANFFRNPERKIPEGVKRVVAPADGKIIKISDEEIVEPVRGRFKKISIFMNIFDVHVNRIPFSGKIAAIRYRKGRFISANLDKASEDNERNIVMIDTDDGRKIIFIQIAGLIARRIVCWIQEGMAVRKGDRYGVICFGSRLELFLPVDSDILVKVGDRVKAGETPIGNLS
jgi:phosphatidylserine decarboxylase